MSRGRPRRAKGYKSGGSAGLQEGRVPGGAVFVSFVEKEIRRVDLKRMELGWLLYSDGFYFGAMDRALKRLFDLAASSAVLLLTAPLLLAAMIAIRWEAPGPVLYRQERVTQAGRHFWILKLRTMRVDAEADGAVWAAKQDGRITRVGTFLRRARIDELPQLMNVLKGDMSIVGPRPERPMFVAELARGDPPVQRTARGEGGADRVGTDQLPLRCVDRRCTLEIEL